MNALITENFPHYLLKSLVPEAALDQIDPDIFAAGLNGMFGASLKEMNEFATKLQPNIVDDEFQRRCAAASLVFDNVSKFDPCNVVNAGADGLFGFESREELAEVSMNVTRAYNYRRDWDITMENIANTLGDASSQGCKDYIESFIPSIESDSETDLLILSKDTFYTDHYLSKMNLKSPEAILAVLATAGIAFTLPAVYGINDDMVAEIKEKYGEELTSYKIYLDGKISEVRSALDNDEPNFDEIWEFADKNITQGLKLRAEAIESAVSKSDQRVKKGLIRGLKDSIPEIASKMVSEDASMRSTLCKEILKALFTGLRASSAYSKIRKENPESGYIYQIRRLTKQ